MKNEPYYIIEIKCPDCDGKSFHRPPIRIKPYINNHLNNGLLKCNCNDGRINVFIWLPEFQPIQEVIDQIGIPAFITTLRSNYYKGNTIPTGDTIGKVDLKQAMYIKETMKLNDPWIDILFDIGGTTWVHVAPIIKQEEVIHEV